MRRGVGHGLFAGAWAALAWFAWDVHVAAAFGLLAGFHVALGAVYLEADRRERANAQAIALERERRGTR